MALVCNSTDGKCCSGLLARAGRIRSVDVGTDCWRGLRHNVVVKMKKSAGRIFYLTMRILVKNNKL